MIPAIGYMVATYILFRMLEVMFFSHDRYLGHAAHGWVIFFAICVIVLVGFMTFVLVVIDITGSPSGN